MPNDFEALTRHFLGLQADLNAIKEVLCRANLTTPDELQKLKDSASQQILNQPAVKKGIADARLNDVLDNLENP